MGIRLSEYMNVFSKNEVKELFDIEFLQDDYNVEYDRKIRYSVFLGGLTIICLDRIKQNQKNSIENLENKIDTLFKIYGINNDKNGDLYLYIIELISALKEKGAIIQTIQGILDKCKETNFFGNQKGDLKCDITQLGEIVNLESVVDYYYALCNKIRIEETTVEGLFNLHSYKLKYLKNLTIISGINGIGKSTLAKVLKSATDPKSDLENETFFSNNNRSLFYTKYKKISFNFLDLFSNKRSVLNIETIGNNTIKAYLYTYKKEFSVFGRQNFKENAYPEYSFVDYEKNLKNVGIYKKVELLSTQREEQKKCLQNYVLFKIFGDTKQNSFLNNRNEISEYIKDSYNKSFEIFNKHKEYVKEKNICSDSYFDSYEFWEKTQNSICSHLYKRVSYVTKKLKNICKWVGKQNIELTTLEYKQLEKMKKDGFFDHTKLRFAFLPNDNYANDSLEYQFISSCISELNELFERFQILKKEFSSFYSKDDSSKKEITIKDGVLSMKFEKRDGTLIDFPDLSSGEKNLINILYSILFAPKECSVLFIDEPEISLHIAWANHLTNSVLEILKKIDLQVIFITHSPFILGGDSNLLSIPEYDDVQRNR